ncbi:fatty acid desaturase family protein [Aeoliella mucimassa]|uniref:Fatty acid desaturase n=1 Tax=Aeoliella mucimassa TaxID=2527972 RepID=A0A518ASQ5_9BACT|nr:fatty acid desaturase [Aeoliella mucimassa]QDU57751.1 Fatty acid desaturase [Aeoliella mucimassa]
MAQASVDLSRREMYAEIRKLCAPDNFTNWYVLTREYVVYAAIVGACVWATSLMTKAGWAIWWQLPVYAVTILAIGFWSQTRLATLVHESSHYLLFKNRLLNDVMANLLVVFPFYGKVGNYRIGHWGHHRNVNDPEHDPDLIRLMKHQDREFPLTRARFIWEYIILQLSPHKAFSYLKGRAEYVAFMKEEDGIKDQSPLSKTSLNLLRAVYYLGMAAALWWFGWIPEYFLYWVLPLVTVYPCSLFLREIAHHGNYPDNGDFTNSRVYEGLWFEREIFFPFGEWNHVLHHMFPTIPWHKMRKAHHVMMRYPPYRDNVVICDGYLFKGHMGQEYPTVLDVLSKPSHAYLRGGQTTDAADIRRSTVDEIGANDNGVGQLLPGES